MVQLTRESSQGDGGDYPAVVAQQQQQPRPIVPQETPHPASLEHHQPRPPSAHHYPPPRPSSTGGSGAASNAPQTHPPPLPNFKYPEHHHHPSSGRHHNPSAWNPTMIQQGTNLQNPPAVAAAANAYYTPRTTTNRDNYNPGKPSRLSTRDAHHYPRGSENSSSSSRSYGNYHGDKENVHSGSNSSRRRSDRENFAYSDRDSNYARNRGKYREGRHKSGESYREMEQEEDIKPKLSRHFEPIRNFGNENPSQLRRGRTESVTSVSSVASSRAPPIGGGSSRNKGYYSGQYGHREMYNQLCYYYQYYRDHPYYKEYYRQLMLQYGQQYPEVYNMDDRSSLHSASGRSSVNDDMKQKSTTSQFVEDFHGRSSYGYPSSIYAEGSFSHLKSYPSGDVSGVGSVPDESVNAARMTPLLFGRAHIKASFTPSGQLLVVLPKDPRDGEKANVQIRSIQKTLVSNPDMGKIIKKMQEFPGPLTIDETHKEVVVKYCERRIAEASADCQLYDKSSVILMWEYLALLVRQNGRLYGTDIARLLLRGRNESCISKDVHKDNENVASPSALNNEHQANFNSPDSGLSLVNTTDFDLGLTNSTEIPSVPTKNETELINKFTEYLCLGRKKEALDYAIQEGLWGHCLALAAKMDSNTHTRVLIAFLNAIPRHNVLQTLFQQLSGKKPEITKTYSEERWGDWQSHLAMMISNPTGNTEKDQASVLGLGDTLAQRGQLHAAHFCYLLANAEWGSFSNKDSKIVLIGANHQLSFQEFASNESIQCTEIYEYGRSLEDKSSSLPFQSYKLIYALRLAEAGLPQEALKYCEVISNAVEKSQTFAVDFLSQVYNLASALKYNDVHYQMCQGELSEMPDPDWLIKLKQQLDNAISKQYAESVAGYGSNLPSDVVDEVAAPSHPPVVSHQQVSTTSDTAVYSQSNNYASGNYASGNFDSHEAEHYHNDYANNVNTEKNDNTQDQQLPVVPMMNPPNQQNEGETNSIPMVAPTHSYTDNGPPSMSRPQSLDFVGVPGDDNIQQHEPMQQHWQIQPGSIEGTDSQESPADSAPPLMMAPPQGSAPPVQWQPGPHLGFMPSEPQPPMPPMNEEEDNVSNSTSNKSKSSLDDSGSDKKKDTDKNQSGGFLSSIFNWKKSNQAILPDDKNPSIVWNEKTQKWESIDGSEEVVAPPPPPPKMGEGGLGALPFPPMRRNARAKPRYVNLESSKVSSPAGGGALPPMPGGSNFSNMAPITPMMPPAASPMMMPTPAASPMMVPTPAASIPQSQDMDMPPNDNAHSHETDSQQQAAGSGNEGGIPMMMAPPSGGSQIQFFNPAQMKSGVAASTGGSSQQRRFGASRRVFPTQ